MATSQQKERELTCKNSHVGNLGEFNASIGYAAACKDGKIIEFWTWWYWINSWYLSGHIRISNRPFCILVRAVCCWLANVAAAAAADTAVDDIFLLVIDANGDVDVDDETDNCVVVVVDDDTFGSMVVWLLLFWLTHTFEIVVDGDWGMGGGDETILPECESMVEWEWGLIMRSLTLDADDESILIVLFEFDGDNCCIWLLNGL